MILENKSYPERNWLIVVRGDNAAFTTTTVQNVNKTLETISKGKSHLAFSSKDACVVGVYAKIAKPAPVIRSMLEKAASTWDRGFVLVLELGDNFAAIGNSSGWRWLSSNQSKIASSDFLTAIIHLVF